MAQKRRYTGKYAAIYYSGVLIGEAFDVSVKVSEAMLEHRAYGDRWQHREPDIGDWSVSCKRYSLASGVGLGGSIDMAATQVNGGTTPVTVAVYGTDGAAGSKIIEGPMWVSEGNLGLPAAGMEEEGVEFVGADEPTFFVGMST